MLTYLAIFPEQSRREDVHQTPSFWLKVASTAGTTAALPNISQESRVGPEIKISAL
jgi:hypothetical protein